jgi:hypothetical protein
MSGFKDTAASSYEEWQFVGEFALREIKLQNRKIPDDDINWPPGFSTE